MAAICSHMIYKQEVVKFTSHQRVVPLPVHVHIQVRIGLKQEVDVKVQYALLNGRYISFNYQKQREKKKQQAKRE
jgi:hypothetical protein